LALVKRRCLKDLPTMTGKTRARIAVALDVPSLGDALPLLERLRGAVPWVKVGLQLHLASGGDAVRAAADLGFEVFLDLKLHDIPNTVGSAVRSLARLPVSLTTVHASGGPAMVRAAVEAAAEARPGLRIAAVSVLTSMDEATLRTIGVAATPADQVARLAALAVGAGAQALVCSPLELAQLAGTLQPRPFFVVPGIRGPLDAADDQSRTLPAGAAARAGADLLIVGRPILRAADPAAAARALAADVDAA
jgi:orotidine-5'-phosphate decarboxylase